MMVWLVIGVLLCQITAGVAVKSCPVRLEQVHVNYMTRNTLSCEKLTIHLFSFVRQA